MRCVPRSVGIEERERERERCDPPIFPEKGLECRHCVDGGLVVRVGGGIAMSKERDPRKERVPGPP